MTYLVDFVGDGGDCRAPPTLDIESINVDEKGFQLEGPGECLRLLLPVNMSEESRPRAVPNDESIVGLWDDEGSKAAAHCEDDARHCAFVIDAEDEDEAPWTFCSGPGCIVRAPPPRKMSDIAFCNPEQTLIIFDWDDTLCPSSACFEGYGLTGAVPPEKGSLLESALFRLAVDVKAALERASSLAATVAIVTNGGEKWVELSAQAWMPDILPALCGTSVSSARARWEPQGVGSPTGWKTREFQELIDRFYSRYANQSWKNIICIGDAPYEHEALRRVVDDGLGVQSTHCRTKSVKFLTKPTVDDVGYQLRKLTTFFENVVYHDGDLDIDFRIPFNFEAVVLE